MSSVHDSSFATAIAAEVVRALREAPPVQREYLTPAEVEQLTGIPIRTLETWRGTRSELPYVKLGNGPRARIRYALADVRAFMERNREEVR